MTMAETREPATTEELDLARECVYRFLSVLAIDPRAPEWERVRDAGTRDLVIAAMDVVRDAATAQAITLARGELGPAALDLRSLCQDLEAPLGALQADYDAVFGLVAPKDFPPYETEYDREGDPFQGAQQLADIAGFYQAFGLRPARNPSERPDHVALELEFPALLLTKKRLADRDSEHEAVCEQALRDFVADHLAWWVPTFANGIARRAGGSYLERFGAALSAFIAAERALLGIAISQRIPMPRLPLLGDDASDDATECGACSVAPN